MKRLSQVLMRLLFGAYCTLMLWLLFGQRLGLSTPGRYLEQLRWNINVVPFRTVVEFLTMAKRTTNIHLIRHAFINLAGNMVMFIPLGLLLPLIWPKLRSCRQFLLYVTSVVAAIELLQLFTLLGTCDIDDLILNVLGATLGFALLWMVSRRSWSDPRRRAEAPSGSDQP